MEKYTDGEQAAFYSGIKSDIALIKNAISHPESSGFVEGNNNKFKLLKRIVYGRIGLVNLAKKCKLAFMPQTDGFSLQALLYIGVKLRHTVADRCACNKNDAFANSYFREVLSSEFVNIYNDFITTAKYGLSLMTEPKNARTLQH